MPPASTTNTLNPSPVGTSASSGITSASVWSPTAIRPNTVSPIRSVRLAGATPTRTVTPRLSVSTAADTSATFPFATGAPEAAAPANSVAACPTCTRAASAGESVSTASSTEGSATSTSDWLGSALAPSTALMRVTTPPIGARNVERSRTRRAFSALAWASASSLAATSASRRGETPASASRCVRSAAFCAVESAASELLAAASNGAWSNCTSASPRLTRAPCATNTFDTRDGTGAASDAT